MKRNLGKKAIVLGAGASRGVSYASKTAIPSPLDRDFFDLLQRFEPNKYDVKAVKYIQNAALESHGERLWQSMERLFYTLYVRATLQHMFFADRGGRAPAQELVTNFTRAAVALLRAAHGINGCEHHLRLFYPLTGNDRIITFNYDLVPERALRCLWERAPFGPFWYGFAQNEDSPTVPGILKLHGSVNWYSKDEGGSFIVRQKRWKDFDEAPGYRARAFSVLLPFWNKNIEDRPWRRIWRRAAKHLQASTSLVICGYSLPLTDIKALELFRLALDPGSSRLRQVCVIDPSAEVRMRWRAMLVRHKFWEYESLKAFVDHPPEWWASEVKPQGKYSLSEALDKPWLVRAD